MRKKIRVIVRNECPGMGHGESKKSGFRQGAARGSDIVQMRRKDRRPEKRPGNLLAQVFLVVLCTSGEKKKQLLGEYENKTGA